MQNFDTRSRAIAYSLSALAGFVDAIGFIGSGGFFVSFMSGNSTRLGVGAATASSHAAVAEFDRRVGARRTGVRLDRHDGAVAGSRLRGGARRLCRAAGYPRLTLTILTGDSIIWPFIAPSPLVGEIGASMMRLTTSMPSTTCPNTA